MYSPSLSVAFYALKHKDACVQLTPDRSFAEKWQPKICLQHDDLLNRQAWIDHKAARWTRFFFHAMQVLAAGWDRHLHIWEDLQDEDTIKQSRSIKGHK